MDNDFLFIDGYFQAVIYFGNISLYQMLLVRLCSLFPLDFHVIFFKVQLKIDRSNCFQTSGELRKERNSKSNQ